EQRVRIARRSPGTERGPDEPACYARAENEPEVTAACIARPHGAEPRNRGNPRRGSASTLQCAERASARGIPCEHEEKGRAREHAESGGQHRAWRETPRRGAREERGGQRAGWIGREQGGDAD